MLKKMKLFVKQDLLLKRVFDDMKKNMSEEEALEIVFYSYVFEDFIMEDIYKKIINPQMKTNITK